MILDRLTIGILQVGESSLHLTCCNTANPLAAIKEVMDWKYEDCSPINSLIDFGLATRVGTFIYFETRKEK